MKCHLAGFYVYPVATPSRARSLGSIDDVLETTLKLTLLHYGSLKSPKLPVMLRGADRIAGLRLRGVYLGVAEKVNKWH